MVATRLDRVGRSSGHLMRVVELLEKKGVTLRFIDQPFQTDTATGRVLVGVLSVFSSFEFEIRRERQLDGIRKAKQNGIRFGRKPLFTDEQRERIRVLREVENYTVPALADSVWVRRRFDLPRTCPRRAGCSRCTIGNPWMTGRDRTTAPHNAFQRHPAATHNPETKCSELNINRAMRRKR